MAVHAYQTVLEETSGLGCPPIFSYLDPRRNRFIFERPGEASFESNTVLHAVKPGLKDIIGLHAVKLESNIERTPRLVESAKPLAEQHLRVDAGMAWRRWCDEQLRPLTRTQKPTEWDEEKYLKTVVLPLPRDDTLQAFSDHFSAC